MIKKVNKNIQKQNYQRFITPREYPRINHILAFNDAEHLYEKKKKSHSYKPVLSKTLTAKTDVTGCTELYQSK